MGTAEDLYKMSQPRNPVKGTIPRGYIEMLIIQVSIPEALHTDQMVTSIITILILRKVERQQLPKLPPIHFQLQRMAGSW